MDFTSNGGISWNGFVTSAGPGTYLAIYSASFFSNASWAADAPVFMSNAIRLSAVFITSLDKVPP